MIDPQANGEDLRAIEKALDSLGTDIQRASTGGLSLDDLVDSHVRTRGVVTRRMMNVAARALGIQPERLLRDVRERVLERMRVLYGGRADPAFLTVPVYGGVHPRLLAYLALHIGQDVSASRL